ncbi:hypothetical protein F9K50_09450 [bacterium]|nr:MAG: hypothetical protein F9K50_09450 [bacterium]
MRIDRELNAIGRILKILWDFNLQDRRRIAEYIHERVETTRGLVDAMAEVEHRAKITDSAQEPLLNSGSQGKPGGFRLANDPMEDGDEDDSGGSEGLAFEIDESCAEEAAQ